MEILEEVIETSIKNKNLYSVQIEITEKCNWRCQHCYLPEYQHYGIKKEKLLELFKELRKLGVFELTLTGGEIFTRNDIFEIIEEARNLGFNVTLFSNVSLLDEKKIKKLEELYISSISCTIFSMREKIHDEIAQKDGALKKCLNNIELLKKYNIPVEIKTIIMKKNLHNWKEVYEFAKLKNCMYSIDYEIFPQNDGNTKPLLLSLNKDEFYCNCKELDKMRGFEAKSHSISEYACDQLRNYILINAKGDVFPCEKFYLKLGNIYLEKIEKIWKESKTLQKIQDIKWGDLINCSNCAMNKYCLRCPGMAYRENGDAYSLSDTACEKAKIRKIIMEEI